MSTFVIELTAERPGFVLQIDLRLERERFAIVGPSGSGKTTLLRTIAGLEDDVEGRIEFRGTVWRDGRQRRVPTWERNVGWLPQDSLVFPHLDALENLRYAEPRDATLERVIEALELEDHLEANARTLSGGERQRVALGRAILSAPELLLLDEPFSALDRRLTSRVCNFLDAWCSEHDCALVVAAHSPETAEPLVDETRRLVDGRLAD